MIDLSKYVNLEFLSLAVLIFGAMLLYFGKIIQDIQVDSADKYQYYFKGLLFSSVHVIIPLTISFGAYYELSKRITISTSEAFVSYVVIIPIIFLLITLYQVYRLDQMRKRGESINSTPDEHHYMIIPWLLFASCINSFVTIYCYFSFIESESTLAFEYLILTIIALIFLLTLLAMIFSFYNVYYPLVRIHLDNFSIIECRMIRYDDTIQIVINNRLSRINREKVQFIEELNPVNQLFVL